MITQPQQGSSIKFDQTTQLPQEQPKIKTTQKWGK